MTEADTTKLHVAGDGQVWALCGNCAPACAADSVSAFLVRFAASNMYEKMRPCRLLGLPANAPLILALHKLSAKYAPTAWQFRVQLASPRYLTPAELADPSLALLGMRRIGAAPSLGGWHDCTDADWYTYALVNHLALRGGAVDGPALALLESHPTWPALSFISGLNREACCALLAAVIDPRWYVDPEHPDRVSSLYTYLGMHTAIINRAIHGKASGKGGAARRAALVLRCWRPDDEAAWPVGGDSMRPGYFLWRVADASGLGRNWLRGCQSFVTFLHHVWLDAIYRPETGQRLFVPEMFFEPYECKAFLEHTKGV